MFQQPVAALNSTLVEKTDAMRNIGMIIIEAIYLMVSLNACAIQQMKGD